MQTTPRAGAEGNASDAPGRYAPVGWDPYEVWRTRVLLPRQAQQVAAPQPQHPQAAQVHPDAHRSRLGFGVYAVAMAIAVVLVFAASGSER